MTKHERAPGVPHVVSWFSQKAHAGRLEEEAAIVSA